MVARLALFAVGGITIKEWAYGMRWRGWYNFYLFIRGPVRLPVRA